MCNSSNFDRRSVLTLGMFLLLNWSPLCAEIGNPVRLNGELVAGGDVIDRYSISPDGSRVVYIADQDSNDVFELYSVSISGGKPAKLNSELIGGGDVVEFIISPNSRYVVYQANQDNSQVAELYSVPINGGVPVKLNSPLPQTADIKDFRSSPDSRRIFFRSDLRNNNKFDLYSASIVGRDVVQHNQRITPNSHVAAYALNRDGSHVVYKQSEFNQREEIYSASLDDFSVTKLNLDLPYFGSVDKFEITPDGDRVIYTANIDTADRFGLYSSLTVGGGGYQINPRFTGRSILEFAISSDSDRIVYMERSRGGDRVGLVSHSISKRTRVKLSHTGSFGQVNVRQYAISGDNAYVVYSGASGRNSVASKLYSVPIAGGTAAKLSDYLNQSDEITEFALSDNSSQVIYMVDRGGNTTSKLYSTNITNGSTARLAVDNSNVEAFSISPDSQNVFYRATSNQLDGHEASELFVVSLSDFSLEKINSLLPRGGDISSFLLSVDNSFVVYFGEQNSRDKFELLSVALDEESLCQ